MQDESAQFGTERKHHSSLTGFLRVLHLLSQISPSRIASFVTAKIPPDKLGGHASAGNPTARPQRTNRPTTSLHSVIETLKYRCPISSPVASGVANFCAHLRRQPVGQFDHTCRIRQCVASRRHCHSAVRPRAPLTTLRRRPCSEFQCSSVQRRRDAINNSSEDLSHTAAFVSSKGQR